VKIRGPLPLVICCLCLEVRPSLRMALAAMELAMDAQLQVG